MIDNETGEIRSFCLEHAELDAFGLLLWGLGIAEDGLADVLVAVVTLFLGEVFEAVVGDEVLF